MASITVRNLDESVKRKLRVQAARHGRSMEEEVREILRTTLAEVDNASTDLDQAMRRRFGDFGSVELEIPPRERLREPPELES
jgi:antitoxin FitA